MPTARPSATPRVHVIASGDYIEMLAAEYGVDQGAITAANGITLNTILRIGQELVIPGPTEPLAAPDRTLEPAITPTSTASPDLTITSEVAESTATWTATAPTATSESTDAPVVHVVQEGENLGILAQEYDVSMQEIADANGIRLNTILSIGQKLVIPGSAVTPTQTTTLSPSPTGTATATIEATRKPTPTWPYLAPRLLAPADDLTADSQPGVILLNWASVGILGEDEFYQVEVRCANGADEAHRFWTQATSWRLDAVVLDDARCAQGAMNWRVRVVRGQAANNTALSLPSATRRLVLIPAP
jgi:LysM repeat protein